MASAREYFRMRESSLREEEYLQELNSHKRKRRLIMIIFIVSVLLIAAVSYIYSKNRVYHDYDILKDTKREDDDSTVYLEYNENMVKYNMDGISCINKENELIWNQTYEMKSPIVDISGKYVAVCDNGGNKIYIFNEEGIQGEVETKLPIKKMCVSGQGTAAILMEEEDVNYIDYYDKSGKLIAENKAPVEKTGFPLDFSLSDDGYKLAISYMMIENTSILTKLAFYNFDSVGENEIDHLVAATNYENDIIPEIEFLTKDTVVVYGTNFWEIYEGTQKPKSIHKEEFSEEIKSVFFDEQHIGLIFKNDAADYPYCMKVYNLKGKLILDKPFGFEYDKVSVKNSIIYMQSASGCRLYNMKGKIIYEGGYEDELQNIIPVNKRKIILVFSNRLLYMRLK